jgi:ubiquinone/menaquinone biosynthesis C-methylase UbiE
VAVLYEKVAVPRLWQFYRQIAAEVTSLLNSGKVLDVGTGPGRLLAEIVRANPSLELVGLDLSTKMLRIASKRLEQQIAGPGRADAGDNNRRALRLVRADVRNLPFSDGEFDLVVSTLSLHHWHNPIDGIRECLRVTAPGGSCWIYDLRTDVPVRAHAEMLVGSKPARLALGWIFRFHGVEARHYQADTLASRLDGDTKVSVDVHDAYLKLNIAKPTGSSQDQSTPSINAAPASRSQDEDRTSGT